MSPHFSATQSFRNNINKQLKNIILTVYTGESWQMTRDVLYYSNCWKIIEALTEINKRTHSGVNFASQYNVVKTS